MALNFLNNGYFAGKVGIGTASPDGLLNLKHVASTSSISEDASDYALTFNFAGTTNDYGRHIAIRDSNGDAVASIGGVDLGGAGTTGLYFATGSVSGISEAMRIDSTGNVGIGTTTPNTALQVNQATTVPLLIHRPSNTNFDPHGIGFSTRNDAANGGLGDVRSGIFSDYNGDLFLAASQSSITTNPGASSRLFIEGSNGNVGIGTTSPQAALHVAGAFNTTAPTGNGVLMGFFNNSHGYIQLNGPSGGYIDFSTSGTDHKGRLLYDNASNYMRFDTNGSEKMRIQSGGNVGIGTTNPLYKIHSSSSGARNDLQFTLDSLGTGSTDGAQLGIQAGGAYIWNFENNDLYFATNNSRVLSIKPSGNVGIGTTSPVAKLHVEGDKSYSLGYLDATSDLHIGNDTMSSAVGAYSGSITFGSTNESNLQAASIVAVQTDTDPNEIGLAFFTQHSSAGSTDLVESMRIKNDGNVGIGTTSPGAKLQVAGTTNAFGNSSVALQWGDTSAIGALSFDGSANPVIRSYSSKSLIFQTNGANERMRISSAGAIKFNAYDGTNQTGTPTYILGTDSSGNVVKVLGGDIPGGGGTVTGTGVTNIIPYWTNGPGGVLGDSIVAQGSQRIQISSGGGSLLLGQWDGANNRIESASRPLFITSYTSPIKLGISGNTTMTIESSNVGIGTTSPTTKLNVSGNIAVSSGSYLSFIDSNLNYNKIGRNTSVGGIQITTGGNATMNLLDNSNVGIGTTSPSKKLEVVGDIKTSGTGNTRVILESGGACVMDLINAQTEAYLRTTTAHDLHFRTTDTNRMVIKAGGNVGIGTTSPGQKLQVSGGNVIINGGSSNNLYLSLTSNYLYGDVNGVVIAGADDNFRIKTNGSERVRVIANGNVGIGTTSPGRKLEVAGDVGINGYIYHNGDDSRIGFEGNDAIRMYTANSVRLQINSNGNVGIGTTSPSQKLQVDGSIKVNANGFFGPGGTGTTDGILSIDGGSGTGGEAYLRLMRGGTSGFILNHTATAIQVRATANIPMFFYTNDTIGIKLNANSTVSFPEYGAGTLVTDASGNITVSSGGGTGGPFLPLTAGSTKPLTGDLYISKTQPVLNITSTSGTDASIEIGRTGDTFAKITAGDTAASDFNIYTGSSIRQTILANGNVGIGTTSPQNPLHVNGSLRIGPFLTPDRDGFVFIPGGTLNTIQANNENTNFDNNQGNIHIRTINNSSATPVERITVLSTGNVGIGTTSPQRNLTIYASSGNAVLQLANNTSGVGASDGFLAFTDGTNVGLENKENGYLSLATNASEKMRIIANGNVGIGTTNPKGKLHVLEGTAGSYTPFGESDTVVIESDVPGGISLIGTGSGSNAKQAITFGTIADVTSAQLIYDSNNSVLSIGTTTASNYVRFNSGNGVEAMRLSAAQDVGIGTTAPVYKLDVNGGVQAGGVVTYSKSSGSLNTTGYAVAGLTAGFNGASAGFEFKCYGGTGHYQRISYSCFCDGTTWRPRKMIDEGSDKFDVTASADGATITFTFKTRSGTQGYSPRMVVQATGHSINSTYA